MAVTMPPMTDPLLSTWRTLFLLHEMLPTGWTLVGGAMVHLHCAERGTVSIRPTVDADTVLDIRADPAMLARFTMRLVDLGFHSAGPSPEGHEHRWLNGEQQIDILIPAGLGRSQKVTGITGSPTVATRGAQQALGRSETVEVDVGSTHGVVNRPNLLGALVIKAAAIHTGSPERHLDDFLTLATLIRPQDRIGEATRRDRHYLRSAVTPARDRLPHTEVPRADVGLQLIESTLA